LPSNFSKRKDGDRERLRKISKQVSNIFEINILSQNNFQTFCKYFGLLVLIKRREEFIEKPNKIIESRFYSKQFLFDKNMQGVKCMKMHKNKRTNKSKRGIFPGRYIPSFPKAHLKKNSRLSMLGLEQFDDA
jgi:hypothetical protein